ncbi:MAG: aldo/keto reductase [Lentisphaerales bacterium]|jgi:methylglyoxal reductase|nr:MAG: aldo/keto reductase [Lentisphaerales bacterium]
MKRRTLGQSGIKASVVGFGAWAVGGWMWGGTQEKDSIAAIHAAIDAGISLIDTAPIYGFGRSEEIVGKAIHDCRDKVVLATKCGLVWHREQGEHYFNSDEDHPRQDASQYNVYRYLGPESIREEVEMSLRRLQTDRIDLYQTHWQEGTTPIADTMATLLKLKQEGKIRAIGVSNVSVAQLDEYRKAGVIDSDQEKYSMLHRAPESDLLPYCGENNIAFLAYSPLAQGLLTGKIGPDRTFAPGDQRNNSSLFSADSRQAISQRLEKFRPIAEAHGVTPGQLAIAWNLQQAGCSHALVGARTPDQARENAGAGDLTLTPDELNVMTQE